MKCCFHAEGSREGHEAQHGEQRTEDECQRRREIWSGHDKLTQILEDCDIRAVHESPDSVLLDVRTERMKPGLEVRYQVYPCAGWVSMTPHLRSSVPSYYVNADVQGYENVN